jgi:hypothetical protein
LSISDLYSDEPKPKRGGRSLIGIKNSPAAKALTLQSAFCGRLPNDFDDDYIRLLRWIKASVPALSFDARLKPPCLSRGLGMRDQP